MERVSSAHHNSKMLKINVESCLHFGPELNRSYESIRSLTKRSRYCSINSDVISPQYSDLIRGSLCAKVLVGLIITTNVSCVAVLPSLSTYGW